MDQGHYPLSALSRSHRTRHRHYPQGILSLSSVVLPINVLKQRSHLRSRQLRLSHSDAFYKAYGLSINDWFTTFNRSIKELRKQTRQPLPQLARNHRVRENLTGDFIFLGFRMEDEDRMSLESLNDHDGSLYQNAHLVGPLPRVVHG